MWKNAVAIMWPFADKRKIMWPFALNMDGMYYCTRGLNISDVIRSHVSLIVI